MKGGQVSPEATMALNEMRQRTSAQEYGRFILEALKSTGLVGRPFNETPIGQAAALRGQPLEQQLAVNENDPAFGFAGTTVGKGVKYLPSSSSLAIPDAPTADLLKQFGRVESVPLDMARGTQSKMNWDAFGSGDHPGALIDGFADRPVAVRREDGEYLIFDGHHRTVSALNEGQRAMDMYVIDARSYAPQVAGRKPAPQTISDDDLLKALFGK